MEGLFCPYLSGRKIADGPPRAVWGMSGLDSRERYGARSPWKGVFVRTCQGELAWRGLQDGSEEKIAGRLNELATGEYFCGISNEELMQLFF